VTLSFYTPNFSRELFKDKSFIIDIEVRLYLNKHSNFKTDIIHIDIVKKLFKKNSLQNDLAKKNIEQYFENYKSIRDYNAKNSKHSLYFDFYKRILTDSISDKEIQKKFFDDLKKLTDLEISNALKVKPNPQSLAGIYGRNWPKKAHTMIGLMRLENLQFCVEETIRNNIEGDLIETGVWRGGATIFMRIILKKYGIKNKIVYAADSFEGLPKPNVNKFSADRGDDLYTYKELKIGLDEVKRNFEIYGVLDKQVKFIKGFFEDTMKNTPIEKLSLLRLDGDMYGSTWGVLENLYEKLSVGGYLIVDDFRLGACQKAIHDFRKLKNIQESIMLIDGSGAYWKKEA